MNVADTFGKLVLPRLQAAGWDDEPQEAINRRKAEYRRLGFERQTRPEAGLDDLDLELVPQLLGRPPLAGRPIPEILTTYGLLTQRGDGFAVTNAALLLFGRAPLSAGTRAPGCGGSACARRSGWSVASATSSSWRRPTAGASGPRLLSPDVQDSTAWFERRLPGLKGVMAARG